MDDPSSKRSFFYRTLTFGLLLLTWLVFSGKLDVFHLALGGISCALVTRLSGDLLFQKRSFHIFNRVSQGWRMSSYLLWLFYQIILANFHLLRLAFSGSQSLQPQIVRYDSRLKSDFEKFLLANSITLTPGTVTIKIIGNAYYVHAISDLAAQGLDGEMERRISNIFRTSPEKIPYS